MLDSPVVLMLRKDLDTNTLAAQLTTAACVLISKGVPAEDASHAVVGLFSDFDQFLRRKLQTALDLEGKGEQVR